MDEDAVPHFPVYLNLAPPRTAMATVDPFYATIDESGGLTNVQGNHHRSHPAAPGYPDPPPYDMVALDHDPYYAVVGNRTSPYQATARHHSPSQPSPDMDPHYSQLNRVWDPSPSHHSGVVGPSAPQPDHHDYSDTQFITNDIYASIGEPSAKDDDLRSYTSEDGADLQSYSSYETQKPRVQRLSQEMTVQKLSLTDGNSSVMSLGSAVCSRCAQGFEPEEEMVNSEGEIWHTRCFVCAQCFQPFPGGTFYEYNERKYCEHDFRVLFAPCCGKCGEFINGRVIKALNMNWHPNCFQCEICEITLADTGFMKNAGRALCRDCNAKEKALGMGKYICYKCSQVIDEAHIKYKGEAYHPYHFNCHSCGTELTAAGREKGGELYCLRCHDKMGIPICGACRRPIEERVVHAMGKTWHVEHFVCAKCEKPFLGNRHYEKKGLAYCETHYHQLFGNICFVCNSVIAGDVFSALNKAWCVNHFACSTCDRKMSQKSKFYEFDLKPVCKNCYERFPTELKKRQKKAYEQSPKK